MKYLKRMKWLLLVVLVLSLTVACGNDGESSNEGSTNATETESTSETETTIESETVTETETETQTENTTETEVPESTQSETAHTHEYTESVTTQPTCSADGVKTFSCACGDSYTEAIQATSHTYVVDENSKKDATCTEAGKEADKVCSVCGKKVTGAKIDKKSHSYGDYVYNNDATQSADGTKSKTCSVCGKVSTTTASGTKLPNDPYSLRAVTDLNTIPVVGKITKSASDYAKVIDDIKAGKYEKIRFVASNGDQFCMWNVRLEDERDIEWIGSATYYWFVAPIDKKFSDGYKYSNVTGKDAAQAQENMILIGRNISSSINESYINGGDDIPPAYREINTTDCPVELYKIVETDKMISVWVESTNCGQEGIGTCGSFECKKTCLRYKTLQELDALRMEKGWGYECMSGENGRIKWNGKLLVNFYYMKR